MKEKSAAEQIDDIIKMTDDWRGKVLAKLRSIVKAADPSIIENVKYKKPSKPEGVPFWSHDGDICFVDILKNAVRLTLSRGAQMKSNKLFNTRLDSKVVRAIDFFEGDTIDEVNVKALVAEAVKLNIDKTNR